MDTARFLGGSPTEVIVPLSGLTVGSTYQVQFFYADNRANINKLQYYSDSAVGTVGRTASSGVNANTGSTGEYVVGTFTADATTQDVYIERGTALAIQVNALVLAETVVIPEPSGPALLGLAGFCLLLRRRRN